MIELSFLSGFMEDVALAVWGALVDWWWLVLPFIFFPAAKDYWIGYHQNKFIDSIDWVNLQLNVPRDVLTTPKAMEQIFTGLSSMASTPDGWWDELLDLKIPYQKGEVPLWISFEIVANRNGISFFIRTPKKFQRLIETQFRSQYSQVEIIETEDYISPQLSLPGQNRDFWGVELELSEPPVFPIKTYDYFEERVEERRLDSMSPLMEIMSHLEDGEEVWFQIVLRGLTKSLADDWKEKSKEKLDELLGKEKTPPVPSALGQIVGGLVGESKNVINQFFKDVGETSGVGGAAEVAEEKKEEKKEKIQVPGDKERIETAARKMAKAVFETVIRIVYQAPKTVFNKEIQSAAINSYLKSLAAPSLNSFKAKKASYSLIEKWFFGGNISNRDAVALFDSFKNRSPDPAPQFNLSGDDADDVMKKMILASDELATLYHFPITQIEAPRLYRVQTKKYEPPPDLPVI